jgi:hypothetical protein
MNQKEDSLMVGLYSFLNLIAGVKERVIVFNVGQMENCGHQAKY